MRGDGCSTQVRELTAFGSPPRAWGRRRFRLLVVRDQHRFTPTCVGTASRSSPNASDIRFTPTCVGTAAYARRSPRSGSRNERVTKEYADAAISGSHTDRADLQRLLADARRGAFKSVIVDDLSRLSRDLGDTWRIVFEDLASVGIRVIDAATGMASDADGARLTFGAMALVNDTFLQLVKKETWRGLEGRALKGFATGGRTFGFSTVQEENPPDLEHPRRVPVIDETEAVIVRRVFEMFVSGRTCKQIACSLNDEGIPAPHDGGPKGKRGNKCAHGWGHTTIRAMLLNQRYVGRWAWNQRKWVRVPGKDKRRALHRPEAEHVVTEHPSLRIVSSEVWDVVQRRFANRKPGKGRAIGGGKLGYSLLAGLLRCGLCGGSFVIVSRRHKNGVSYANFGCSVNRSRGASICKSTRTVSERKVTETVVGALKAQLTTPGLIEQFQATFTRRFDELNTGGAAAREAQELEREIHELEGRVRNVTLALAKIGFSEALAAQLGAEETKLTDAKDRLSHLRTQGRRRVLPHPKVIETYLRNLLGALDRDKDTARTLLARHMPPLLLTPEGSAFRITGGFDLSICLDEQQAAAGWELRPPPEGRPFPSL